MKYLVKKRTCLLPHGTFYTHTHHSLSLNSVQSPRRKEKFVQKDSGERIKPLTLLKKTIQSCTTSLKLGM
jgi:hypothetical protein